MISEKEYLKLIKQLPYQQCPNGLTAQVIKKCGLLKDTVNKKSLGLFTEIKYGFACLTIICFILGLGVWQKDYAKEYPTRLALNTKTFFGQLADDAYIIFTSQNQTKKG